MATLLRHRRAVVTLWLLMTLALAPGLGRLEVDNSPAVFFVRDAEALERHERFRRVFGGGADLRLVLSGEGLWSRDGLAWLEELETRAAELPGVASAIGLWGRHRLELLDWPPADPAAFRERVLADPLDRNAGWVGGGGALVTVTLRLEEEAAGRPQSLLAGLEGLFATAPPGVEGRLAGLPVIERAMDDAFATVVRRLFPLLALAAAAILGGVFRRPADVVRPLAFVAVCLTGLFGAAGWSGARLNLVTVVLAPLLFVLSLATAVHMQLAFRRWRRRGLGAPEASLAMLREKGWAVLWTGFTTAAAFASFVTSSVPPVRALGLWCAAGLGGMTAAAFTLLPCLLAGERSAAPPPQPFEVWGRRVGVAAAAWVAARRGRVLAAAVVVALVAAAGLPRLAVETRLAGYFAPGHPARATLEELETQGVGAVAAELVLLQPPGEGAGFRDPEALERLSRLSAELRREPRVLGAVGAGDLMRAMLASLVVEGEADDDLRWLVLGLAETDPAARPLLASLLPPGGGAARMSLGLPLLGHRELEPVFERAAVRARELFPDAEVWVTGEYPLVLAAQRELLATMLASLGLTLLVVVAVFLALVGAGRRALPALLPNLWPVLGVAGAMGWWGVPLDSTTVMTAAVVLGLAVDDTFHTLGALRRHDGALRRALAEVAPAHLLTSLLLVCGFGICAFSGFLPVARFGALIALGVAAALAGDLLLLPALWAGARPLTPAGRSSEEAGSRSGGSRSG